MTNPLAFYLPDLDLYLWPWWLKLLSSVKWRHWPQLIINRAALTAVGSLASERKRYPWKSSSVKNSIALLLWVLNSFMPVCSKFWKLFWSKSVEGDSSSGPGAEQPCTDIKQNNFPAEVRIHPWKEQQRLCVSVSLPIRFPHPRSGVCSAGKRSSLFTWFLEWL